MATKKKIKVGEEMQAVDEVLLFLTYGRCGSMWESDARECCPECHSNDVEVSHG